MKVVVGVYMDSPYACIPLEFPRVLPRGSPQFGQVLYRPIGQEYPLRMKRVESAAWKAL